jgi:hypothetical protein
MLSLIILCLLFLATFARAGEPAVEVAVGGERRSALTALTRGE